MLENPSEPSLVDRKTGVSLEPRARDAASLHRQGDTPHSTRSPVILVGCPPPGRYLRRNPQKRWSRTGRRRDRIVGSRDRRCLFRQIRKGSIAAAASLRASAEVSKGRCWTATRTEVESASRMCPIKRTIRGTAGYHAFATSQRRMRSATCVAVASGDLVEYLQSRRTQYRHPTRCQTSSIRYVGPPRCIRLMQISAGSLDTYLTLRIL